MPVVPAFHSVKENRYHDNSKCGPGSEIPAHNRVAGKGNPPKPHCADCQKATNEGN